MPVRAILALVLGFALLAGAPALAESDEPAHAVKGFFGAVSGRDYALAWRLLSTGSRDELVRLVARDENMSQEAVRNLFERDAASVRTGFWDPFRAQSRCEKLAPHEFRTRVSRGNMAWVEIPGSATRFRAFRENGGWRFGLMETFPANP